MIRRYLSSIVVRQALLSTAMMLAAVAVIAFAARITVERQQQRTLLALIDTDIAGLTDDMMSGGAAEVARRIDERIQVSALTDAHYRLTDAKGARVAGDLTGAMPLNAALSQSGEITTPDAVLLARATLLRGGYQLVVARSLAPTKALLARLSALFGLAAIPAALFSLLVGGWLARRLGTRVRQLNTVFDRFERGEHDVRTQWADRSDELAVLGHHVDQHLGRTAKLIQTQRGISENIAHELRTPLGHLDTRLLRAIAISREEPVADELDKARADIRSIVSLFDVLLDLALAESRNADSGQAAVFDLSEHLGNLAELYVASAEEAGLEYTARIAPGITMRGEAMAMTRAVANLLDNAFKAAPAGCSVRLMVSEGPRIVVEDNGPGLPATQKSDAFERVRGPYRPGQGTGLGLALVRVIAARHGLVARFEDAVPGARFILAPEGIR